MAKKTRKKKSAQTKNNGVWVFIAIIIVIAIISMLISYYWVADEKPEVFLMNPDQTIEVAKTDKTETTVPATPIDGTWVSNYDGAMLTISGGSFSLEIPGVDEGSKTIGRFSVEGNICTFTNTGGDASCKGNEGHYLYSLDDAGDLSFDLIKDICESRKERMSASWFSL